MSRVEWHFDLAIVVSRRLGHFDQKQDIGSSRMGIREIIIARTQEHQVRLGLRALVQVDRILDRDLHPLAEQAGKQTGHAPHACSVAVAYGRQLDDLSFDELEAIILAQDTGFGHPRVLSDGESSPRHLQGQAAFLDPFLSDAANQARFRSGQRCHLSRLSIWGHHYIAENSAAGLAQETLRQARRFDWDYLKPQSRAQAFAEMWGLTYTPSDTADRKYTTTHVPLQNADGLAWLQPAPPTSGALGEQVEALRQIRDGRPGCARFQGAYDLRVLGAAADFVAPEFFQVVEDLPGLRIVVEHLGSVRLADPRREKVFELARYPNLYIKVPGLGEFAQRRPPVSATDPF
jgi:hypothetical protein